MKIRNGYGSCMLVIVLLALIFTTINDEAFAATTGAPTIGTFRNHMNNQKNRFTFETNALGQTVISYNTKTNWDIALAYVNGYTSEYTRLCVTVAFTGTQQFGVEVEVIGKSGYVLRDTETLALNKLAIINADGSYTYDLSIPSSVRSSGISEVHLYIDPTAKVSSTRSMKILDIGFRKDGEPAYSLPASQYTVTVNGSYAAASGAGSYAQGATVSISAGQRSEYTFSGWSTTTSGITFANAGDETTTFVMPARDVTVTANWSQYTLTYNANGGSGTVPAKQTGGIVTVSGQGGMTYSGYTFTGWNTKQDGGDKPYIPGDTIDLTANMTLYAQWEAIPYTVTVNGSYAAASGADSYTKGTTVSISAGQRLEYTFSGWSTTTSGVTFANAGSETTTFVMPARAVTVTARWSQYTLTYDANGGSGTVPAQTGGIVTVSGQGGMTYSGYTFTGWNTKQDGKGVSYKPRDEIRLTANMTLYAQWAAIPYTVTVNGSYAEESGAGSYTKGTTVSISAGQRSEYTFSGWSTTTSGVTFANAGSETTTFVMPARDVTVTANWSQFTLTYNANGGSGTVPAQTGGIVTVSGQGGMTYSGYTFIGWNTKQDGSDKPYIPGDTIDLTANMTLYAQWATSGNKPAKLFLVGDSTCVVQPNSKLDTDIQGWGYYFKDKVQSNMTVINLASGGATIRSFLDGQDYKLLAKQWSEADYVLLSLGINDAEKLTKQLYKDGLNEFLDLAALRGVIVVFATSQTSQGLRYTYSGRVDDMKEVALSRGIVCLPLNEYTAANMPRSYMTPDNYHPNNLGARYVGDALALLLDESSSSLKYYLNDTTRLDTAHLLNPMPGNSDAAAKVAMDKVRNAPDTLTKTGNGKIYYVSTSGNDNNDGLSPEKAWKTLTKVRSVPAGKAGNINVVLFRRGDIFRGQLYTQNYVSYGAYGVGYKPNIYISERNYNNSSDWVNSGGNVWECQTKIASDVGNIVFNHGENVGIKKDKKTLTGNFDYYYDPSTRKVSMYYNGGNPADKFWDIEFSKLEQIVIISSGNTVTLENLCFKYGGAHGVCGDNNTNITIRGCEFGWIGGGYLEGTSRYGNAIENWGNCDGFLVENCYIYQIYDAALTHQGDTGNVKKVTYRNNLVEYCTYSIEYFYRKNTARMTDILYEGNIMRFSGYGWGEQRSDKGYATHIQSWGHSNTATNFVIRNNILDKARYYLCDINADAGAQYLPSMIGNTYMQNINMNGVAWRNSRQKFGSGIDVWIKANMDATATVVFY